jgi:ferredoxin-thioredoxin reductase catalytic subunit
MIDLQFVKANVKSGYVLNPNEKVVNSIIKGLNRCNGECPCANTGSTLEDRKCPCKNYRDEGHCCCHLYIKQTD